MDMRLGTTLLLSPTGTASPALRLEETVAGGFRLLSLRRSLSLSPPRVMMPLAFKDQMPTAAGAQVALPAVREERVSAADDRLGISACTVMTGGEFDARTETLADLLDLFQRHSLKRLLCVSLRC